MKIHVITQCTARKVNTTSRAVDLYASRPHKMLATAYRRARMRGDVTLWIVSAGYGLLRWDNVVAPYDITFANKRVGVVERMGQDLNLPQDLSRVLAGPGLKMVALGTDYMRACGLYHHHRCRWSSTLFLIPDGSKRIKGIQGGVRVAYDAGTAPTRYGVPQTGVKQALMSRWLNRGPAMWHRTAVMVRSAGPGAIWRDVDVVD